MEKETIKRVLYELIETYRNYLWKDNKVWAGGGMGRNYLLNKERLEVFKYLLEKEKRD